MTSSPACGRQGYLIQTQKVSCHYEGVARSNLKEEGLLRFARNDIVFNAFDIEPGGELWWISVAIGKESV